MRSEVIVLSKLRQILLGDKQDLRSLRYSLPILALLTGSIIFWELLMHFEIFQEFNSRFIFVVLFSLFCLAKIIVPLTNAVMIADFKACGGFILVATGLRILQVKNFPVADMLPAMVLVMPISYAWTTWILPLVS